LDWNEQTMPRRKKPSISAVTRQYNLLPAPDLLHELHAVMLEYLFLATGTAKNSSLDIVLP
jgi:hypothetical protein